jgi:hypothetical protein
MDLRCRSTYITKRNIDQLIHTEKEERKDEPVDRRSRGGKDKLLVMQDPLDHVRLQLLELLHRYLERSHTLDEVAVVEEMLVVLVVVVEEAVLKDVGAVNEEEEKSILGGHEHLVLESVGGEEEGKRVGVADVKVVGREEGEKVIQSVFEERMHALETDGVRESNARRLKQLRQRLDPALHPRLLERLLGADLALKLGCEFSDAPSRLDDLLVRSVRKVREKVAKHVGRKRVGMGVALLLERRHRRAVESAAFLAADGLDVAEGTGKLGFHSERARHGGLCREFAEDVEEVDSEGEG